MKYSDFLDSKERKHVDSGFEIKTTHPAMFIFQSDITRWAAKKGRAAIFAGTGLGKTLMELDWAGSVVKETDGSVLILAPLAVSRQFFREADKFEIPLDGITIINYQKLHTLDPEDFSGVVLDESSILKSFDGKTRTRLIDAFKNTPYRLACTATPAPNDFMELGNHAEFLGVITYTEMLSTWFVHDGGETQKWRLKGHAQDEFWRWVCSWAINLGHPADLGYEGSQFDLPALHQFQHFVKTEAMDGMLFPVEAQTLQERLVARRSTINERVELAADLVRGHGGRWVVWCNLNAESDLLRKMITGSVEVRGSMSDAEKEGALVAFSEGKFDVLVTKPSICGFGMNWQHCHNTCFVGLNDSYEQVYQAIRRFWRFGQDQEVNVHFIAADIEGAVVQNIQRKERQAADMRQKMIVNMKMFTDVGAHERYMEPYKPEQSMEIPSWMS